MSDETRWEQALAEARDERPPAIDVVARVAARVSALPAPRRQRPLVLWLRRWDVDPSLAAAAGLSLAAAALALVIATPWITTLLDPLLLWVVR